MRTMKTAPEVDYDLLVVETAREHIRKTFKRISEKHGALAGSQFVRIRPRVSLVTGSVFVLLTLYLSTVVGKCGDATHGVELARGDPNISWPGILFLENPVASRSFYLFCLALAAVTILLVVASRIHPRFARQGALVTTLYTISAVVALFSTSDLFSILYVYRGESIQECANLDNNAARVLFLMVLFFLSVACLRRDFWKPRGAITWITIAGGLISLCYLENRFLSGSFTDLQSLPNITVFGAFSLLPLCLWLRYWVFQSKATRLLLSEMRKRLSVFYAIIGTFDFVNFATGVEGYWGLLAFFVGVHLIFLGYWQLSTEAAAQPPVLSIASAETVK
jgi:hypothetical protein